MEQMTWEKYAELFGVLAKAFHDEWKCDLPGFDTLPSGELDKAVSAWCYVIAKDLRPVPPDVPDVVRPWVVVRMICAQAICRSLAKRGDTEIPQLAERILREFLISEWHAGW